MIPLHRVIVVLAPALCASGLTWAQGYPAKPIRMLTGQPGGNNDVMARLLAQGLSSALGQTVIVENRPSPLLGPLVAKAAPDGYTLLLSSGSLWLLPFLQDNVPYDAVRDFTPISLTNRAPSILVVHPSLPVKSVRDLVNLAKARPGALNYAAGPTGTLPHLAAEMFKNMAKVSIAGVHYKGAVAALNDVMSGQLQLMFATTNAGVPLAKAGRLRGLASTSAQPSPLLPGLPTVAATLPGYRAEAVYGIWGPAKMPPALVGRLSQEITRVVTQPDTKEKFFIAGLESVGTTPEQFDAEIKAEMASMGKMIRDAGIRGE